MMIDDSRMTASMAESSHRSLKVNGALTKRLYEKMKDFVLNVEQRLDDFQSLHDD